MKRAFIMTISKSCKMAPAQSAASRKQTEEETMSRIRAIHGFPESNEDKCAALTSLRFFQRRKAAELKNNSALPKLTMCTKVAILRPGAPERKRMNKLDLPSMQATACTISALKKQSQIRAISFIINKVLRIQPKNNEKKDLFFWLSEPDKLLKTNNIKIFLRKTNPSEPEKLLKTQGFMAKSARIAAIYLKTQHIISCSPKTKPELPRKRTQAFRTVPAVSQ